MTKDETLRLALRALRVTWYHVGTFAPTDEAIELYDEAITSIEAALEAKDEPYALEASMYSNDRMKVDPVTGNVSIGTVTMPCGLECDCTDVCKQDDYKALWQQMCERCDELDKKLAQRKPLTDEEMKTVVEQELVNYWDGEYIDTTGARDCLTKFARAIEAAHGIKGEA
jgi:hypothetical protein